MENCKQLKTRFGKIAIFILIFQFWLIGLQTHTVYAQIVNPAVGDLGGVKKGDGSYTIDQSAVKEAADGSTLLKQFVRFWGNAITIGALMVIGYLVLGAIEWILSGGDSGKLDKARQKMTHAVIGMVILVSSFIIIGFISSLLFGENFDLLNLQFFTPTTQK